MTDQSEIDAATAVVEAIGKAAAGIQDLKDGTAGELRKALEAYPDDQRVVFLSQAGGQETINGVTQCYNHDTFDQNDPVVEIF